MFSAYTYAIGMIIQHNINKWLFHYGFAQGLVQKVLGADLLRLATSMPLPAGIAKIPDVFLLFGVDRDDGWPSFWKARTCRLTYSNWA